jgi:hypothetical protein
VFVKYGLRDLSLSKDCSDLVTTLLKVFQS